MLLTRIGENSRMVITGDLDQHDRMDEINGLADFLDKYHRNRSNSISSIEFNKEHVEREDVIKDVLSIYDDTNCHFNYDDTNYDIRCDDEKTPSLISISPDSNESVLDNVMERKNSIVDDEKDDIETIEYDNINNSIPNSSFLM
jgi:uncharacterized protein (DUF885 family)